MDYQFDPTCPFDNSQYVHSHATDKPVLGRISVPEIIEKVDAFYASDNYIAVRDCLEENLKKARELNDTAGELAMLSELLGCYRYTQDEDRAMRIVPEAFELVKQMGLEGTATAGTVFCNGATTLKEFGRAAEALPYYKVASRAYSETLDPHDYRFASLFNNMGTCLSELGDYDEAESCYKRALSIVKALPNCQMEVAVSLVNLANHYGLIDSTDDRIYQCIEEAIDVFNDPSVPQDSYYTFNAMKCVGAFEQYGFFKDAKLLKERVDRINHELS